MVFKNWINLVFGTSGALTGDEIPYDGSTSLKAKIDNNVVPKASQGEVDAGTNDTKFVTPLTLEGKPKDIGELKVIAFAKFSQSGGFMSIADSEGFSSISRTSVGRTYLEFTTARPNTDYIVSVTVGGSSSSNPFIGYVPFNLTQTTDFSVYSKNDGNAFKDCDVYYVTVSERS